MPTYNVEPYMGKAIDSVLAQKFQDWELIVVNDGSPDNCAEIAQTYADEDSRISVVHKPNGGLSDARNFGLKYAKGDYVHFFDPDDYISNDYYQEMYEKAISERSDVIISGYKVEYINDKGDRSVE